MRRLSILLISAVMALTLIALAVGTGASAQQQNKFYATAYVGDKAYYFGEGTSKAAAIQDGLATCKANNDTNCTAQEWVYNGWLVILEGKTGQGQVGTVYSYGRTKQKAVDQGMKLCKEPPPFTGCKPVGSWETAFDKTKPTKGGPL